MRPIRNIQIPSNFFALPFFIFSPPFSLHTLAFLYQYNKKAPFEYSLYKAAVLIPLCHMVINVTNL